MTFVTPRGRLSWIYTLRPLSRENVIRCAALAMLSKEVLGGAEPNAELTWR